MQRRLPVLSLFQLGLSMKENKKEISSGRCTSFHLLILTKFMPDLGLVLVLFCVSICFTAFVSVWGFALCQQVFCDITTKAHLRRTLQRLQGALLLGDKGISIVTSSQPMDQLS